MIRDINDIKIGQWLVLDDDEYPMLYEICDIDSIANTVLLAGYTERTQDEWDAVIKLTFPIAGTVLEY